MMFVVRRRPLVAIVIMTGVKGEVTFCIINKHRTFTLTEDADGRVLRETKS